jgi:hypothetical protein
LKPEIDSFYEYARPALEKVKNERGLLRSALVYASPEVRG